MLSPSMKVSAMGRRSISSRTARWLAEPEPASPMKASRSSGAWPRSDVAARATRTKAVAAPRRRPTQGLEALAGRPHRHPRQLVVEVDGGGDALPEVAEVEALVLGMGIARRVLDPGEQAGRAPQ